MSRRAADDAIARGRVSVNGETPTPGQDVTEQDIVALNGRTLTPPEALKTIMLNKPVGFVVSREGQGTQTIYELLPSELRRLKPVGRLDKDSSGLLLLTNDGQLAQGLTHPSHHKQKIYEVRLSQPLQPLHRQMISGHGIELTDGPSKLELERMHDGNDKAWRISMHEGRNRQIRRTFASLGYNITGLHRTHFGQYALGQLRSGSFQEMNQKG